MAPIPGQEPTDRGEGQGLVQGSTGIGENGMGGLLNAPIPGASSGDNSPGSGLGGTAAGNLSQRSGGGNEAGSGTMDMFDKKDNITKAEKESRVVTQLNEGDSEFRTVEGAKVRSEEAKLSRQQIVKNFIDVEEEALDEQTLPIARRKQVLRYFSEIRRQLEAPEK